MRIGDKIRSDRRDREDREGFYDSAGNFRSLSAMHLAVIRGMSLDDLRGWQYYPAEGAMEATLEICKEIQRVSEPPAVDARLVRVLIRSAGVTDADEAVRRIVDKGEDPETVMEALAKARVYYSINGKECADGDALIDALSRRHVDSFEVVFEKGTSSYPIRVPLAELAAAYTGQADDFTFPAVRAETTPATGKPVGIFTDGDIRALEGIAGTKRQGTVYLFQPNTTFVVGEEMAIRLAHEPNPILKGLDLARVPADNFKPANLECNALSGELVFKKRGGKKKK